MKKVLATLFAMMLAVCYAFADYLFDNADGLLEGGSGDDDDEDEGFTMTL